MMPGDTARRRRRATDLWWQTDDTQPAEDGYVQHGERGRPASARIAPGVDGAEPWASAQTAPQQQ